MPANDIKSSATPFHLFTGGIYSPPAKNSAAIDLAQYSGGAVLGISVNAVTTNPCVITVEDSDDNATFAATSYTFTEPVGTPSTTRWIFVHPAKVRQYVRISFLPGGTNQYTGGQVTAFAFKHHNGIGDSITYSVDTGS